jgi:hypothetical protein
MEKKETAASAHNARWPSSTTTPAPATTHASHHPQNMHQKQPSIHNRAEVARCEKPKHAVLATLGPAVRAWFDRSPAAQVWRYEPTTVATVDVDADSMRHAASRGFRSVASFIFGGNEARPQGAGADAAPAAPFTDPAVLAGDRMVMGGGGAKVAMTSPVVMLPPRSATAEGGAPGGAYTVQFVMPSCFEGPDALPIPSNPNVKVQAVPGVTVARLAWRGGPRPDDAMVAARLAELKAALAAHGGGRWRIEDEGVPPRLLGYYPPFAPRWQQLHAVEVGVVEVGGVASE